MSKIVAEHVQKRTLVEYLHFPEHDERTETKEFINSKKKLESVEHLGCYKCGTMKKRQSHHIFERSWSNGMDFKRVAFFLFNHFDFHGHCHRDFKSHEDLLQFFIDHYNGHTVKGSYIDEESGVEIHYEYIACDDDALDTIYNQWILCETEHVGKFEGVHYIDGAAFMSSLALHPNFRNVMTKDEDQFFEKEQS